MVEPWLRGTLTDVPAVPRAVLHALELAREDIEKWCGGLTDQELGLRPLGLAPVAFHIRHIGRSLDRLLTYLEERALSPEQRTSLETESDCLTSHDRLFDELDAALTHSAERIRAIDTGALEQPRLVGNKQLPTTLGGLLVHLADHTQRHAGQAVLTAKVVLARR
jgi:hypothetical protein